MIRKSVTLLIVLVSIAFVLGGAIEPKWDRDVYDKHNTSSNHLTVGQRLPGDRLVLVKSVFKDWSILQIVKEEQNFNISRWERITQVLAVDMETNGKGATASLLDGGPGNSDATLRFKSQRGQSIKFVVGIYAKDW